MIENGLRKENEIKSDRESRYFECTPDTRLHSRQSSPFYSNVPSDITLFTLNNL